MIKICYALVISASLCSLSPAADRPARLQLRNGDYWAGQLVGPAPTNVIAWQSPALAHPCQFAAAGVGAIHFTDQQLHQAADADLCVELLGGDILFGSLVALGPQQLKLATTQFGVVSIDTTAVARISSRDEASGIEYAGPNGLDQWREVNTQGVAKGQAKQIELRALGRLVRGAAPPVRQWSTPAWREEAGQLVADRPGNPLARDCKVPERCEIEFSLSWQGAGNFRLTFYLDGDEGPALPIHFQVWNRDLVMVAEGHDRADLALVGNLGDESGRLHATLLVDRPAGRAELFSLEGLSLGQIALPPTADPKPTDTADAIAAAAAKKIQQAVAARRAAPTPAPTAQSTRVLRSAPGVTIQNAGGEFRFERLVIRSWDGRLPTQGDSTQVRVVTAEGERLESESIEFDLATGQFLLGGGDQSQRVDLTKVATVVFPNSQASRPRPFRITLGDSTRLTGDLRIVDEHNVALECRDVHGLLRVPIDSLSSIVSLELASEQQAPAGKRLGRLVAGGVLSSGRLVDAKRSDNRSSLVWHPWGATAATPLAKGLAGRIEFRDLEKLALADEARARREAAQQIQQQRRAAAQVQAQQPQGLFGFLFGGGSSRPAPPEPAEAGAAAANKPLAGTMYLAGGERIPCTIKSVDDSSVTFESSITAASVVPRDRMLMWERDEESALDKLDPLKRERLFVLPRVQRNNPPTHVIESTGGDFLRARLVGIDGDDVVVEVRLETKQIPASTIQRIVWLDTEPAGDQAAEPAANQSDTPVLAVCRGSLQLAMVPHEYAGDTLLGTSDLLGACKVGLGEVDVLYLGDEIAKHARASKLAAWKMTEAKDPKFMSEDAAAGDGTPGLESPLVGQPAPPFKLQTLDGKNFELDDLRGQVVVLDFFANWCGPCVQAMPQVEAVADELADRGVKLVAVNMQEDADSVRGLLARLEIEPIVVLDIDGATAQKYQVSAIPQTVIIDRDGKVARLFVGGGPQFVADLRTALQAVLDPGAVQPGDTGEPL
jgi:thiol-disulfide isomerase/thioredoxin